MDMSDVPYVYQAEREVFGKSLDMPMLYDEVIYNQMAHYFIACFNQERVGYIGCWITEPNAEILNLLVQEPYRKQGIGGALVNHVVQLCQENAVQALTLEVNQSDEATIRFYENHGFKIIATRKQYYATGDNALLMMLNIRGEK